MGVDSTLDNSAKFAAFGWVGVGIYGISNNSAKFAEFAAFAGVGCGSRRHFRYFGEIRRIRGGRGQGGDTSEHNFRLVKVTEIAAFRRVELVVVNIFEVPKT